MISKKYYAWKIGRKLTKEEEEAIEIVNYLLIPSGDINIGLTILNILFNNMNLKEFVENNKHLTTTERELKYLITEASK